MLCFSAAIEALFHSVNNTRCPWKTDAFENPVA